MTKDTLKAIEQIGKHVLNVEEAVAEIATKFLGLENRMGNVEDKLEVVRSNSDRITELEKQNIRLDAQQDQRSKWSKIIIGILSSALASLLATSIALWLRLS